MTSMTGRGTATAAFGVIPAPRRMAIALANPVVSELGDYVERNRALVREPVMVTPETFAGQFVAICGAGPSLREARIAGVDQILGCNSALPWLHQQGVAVTGGVGIDQTARLLDDWQGAPRVTCYLATSVDPIVVEHLLAQNVPIRFFHNAVGIPDEQALYRRWPSGFMVGRGATVVGRFAWVALWAGAERVDIYGADCALGPEDLAHANGEHVTEAFTNPLILTGTHPPQERVWRTRPDLLLEAVDLVRLVRAAQGRVRLVGDTLPVSLLGKDDPYLDTIIRRLAPSELAGAPHGE